MPTISEATRRSHAIFRESSAVFAAQVMMLVAGALNNFLVARLGGPDGKGIVYTLQLFSTAALVFANFGIGPAAVYHFHRDEGFSLDEITSGLLWPSFLLGCIPLLAVMLLRQSSIAWIHTGSWNSAAVLAFAVVPAYTLIWNLSYLYLAKSEMAGYNLLRASSQVLFTIMLFALLAIHSAGIRPLIVTWMLSIWTPAVLALVVMAGTTGIWRFPSRRFVQHAFGFGWRSHLGAVVQYLQHRADVVLVLYYLPLRDLGIYSLAVGLAELLWYVPQSVSQVLLPHIAASEDADADDITSAFCRTSVAITALLSVLLALTATLVIPWILPAFRSAVPLLWILLPGTVVASIFKVLASDLNGRGQPLRTLFPPAAALLFSLAVCSYAIPRFGMIGAAVVSSLSYLLNASLYLYSYSRNSALNARSLVLLQFSDIAWYRRLLSGDRS